MLQQLPAIIEREGTDFVALCPELDIAREGTIKPAPATNPAGSARERRCGAMAVSSWYSLP